MTDADSPGAAARESGVGWTARRVGRHAGWLRTEGLKRLIEEDDLNLVGRWRRSRAKRRWADADGIVGEAAPVFVVGLQRSGTNLVVRLLDRLPEAEVHNENSRVAFDRFWLRDDQILRDIVDHSPHRVVVFKALMDSYRVAQLLDDVEWGRPARAIWVFRNPDARARSAVAKFGNNNLDAITAIADGRSPLPWQAAGLSADAMEFATSFDPATLSPEAGAMLVWYLRNSIFFDEKLDRREDVLALSYEMLAERPPLVGGAVLQFIGLSDLADGLDAADVRAPQTIRYDDIPTELRRRCEELHRRLRLTAARQLLEHSW